MMRCPCNGCNGELIEVADEIKKKTIQICSLCETTFAVNGDEEEGADDDEVSLR